MANQKYILLSGSHSKREESANGKFVFYSADSNPELVLSDEEAKRLGNRVRLIITAKPDSKLKLSKNWKDWDDSKKLNTASKISQQKVESIDVATKILEEYESE